MLYDEDEKEAQSHKAKYTKLEKIGEGTFAVVYKAKINKTDALIAIKKIKVAQGSCGIDISALREIWQLKCLQHENIIKLIDVYASKHNLNIVLDFCEYDLEMLIKDNTCMFSASNIKTWMAMILSGLCYLHSNWCIHRDLKPSNVLVYSDGQLKLADFGLARNFGFPITNLTPTVVTRWYRAPELLLGARQYGAGVDIWAVGAIFAELMLRTPFIAGESDIDQLDKTFRALGTPTEDEWPGISSLPDYSKIKIPQYPKTPLKSLFIAASDSALDLLQKLLTFDPMKRISAKEALLHPYFTEYPKPTHPSILPMPHKKNKLDEALLLAQEGVVQNDEFETITGADSSVVMIRKGVLKPRRLNF